MSKKRGKKALFRRARVRSCSEARYARKTIEVEYEEEERYGEEREREREQGSFVAFNTHAR